jgi:ABC-2 type transport system permease protein
MKIIFKIARTELRTLFYSPIAWLLLIAFFVQCGASYVSQLNSFASMQKDGGFNLQNLHHITSKIFEQDVFTNAIANLYLYIPLVSMGLLSRETSSGTIKLLYTSPIPVRSIVLGKFLSMVIYSLLMVAMLGFSILFGLFQVKDLDLGMLISGLSGIFLLLITYSAIGLFMSSLTSYQLVAAVGTFITIGLLSYVGNVGQRIDFVRDLTYYLSLKDRTYYLLNGLVNTKDVLYYLTISFMFIGFTYYKIKADVESKPLRIKVLRYGGVFIITLAVIYVTSRPALIGYYDATANHEETLTPNAQKIIRDLGDSPLEVDLYNNVLAPYLQMGLPDHRNETLSNWDLYLRFKPGIRFKFIQYYAPPLGLFYPFEKMYPGLTLVQAAQNAANAYDLDFKKFKTAKDIGPSINLEPELNRQVMLLKYKGKTTFLRTFDDPLVWPSETEISAAFKRLEAKNMPKIEFVTGNLERSVDKNGDRDYKQLINLPSFRYSLLNQGFDADTLTLDSQNIPDNIAAIVIADPKTSLSPAALSKLRNYISKGGNLLIAGEPGKQAVLAPILQELGVDMMDGTVVQASKELPPDLALVEITPFAATFTKDAGNARQYGTRVAMPGVAGLSYTTNGSFHIQPLLVTDAKKSWIKKDKLVADSGQVAFNPAAGDIRISVPTALALSRKIDGREQRIIVTGDADFMDNYNLRRNDAPTANFAWNTAMFSWLSGGEFPIDTSRPNAKDTRILISLSSITIFKIIYLWIIPAILVVFAAVLLIRRKRR